MRPIDGEEVTKFFKTLCRLCGKEEKYNGVMCRTCALEDAIDYVDDLPTLNVKPVVKGEWDKTYKFHRGTLVYSSAKCSQCGKLMSQYEKNFCAACGADMREEQI